MHAGDGFAPFAGGRTYYSVVGDGDAPPLVVLHGGPGLPHGYLEPLADLGSRGHPVVFYDQVGVGRSEDEGDESRWVMATFVDQLDALVEHLELHHFHVLGHSWGGWLALEWVLDRRPSGLGGLVLASTCASLPAFAATTLGLKARLPAEVRDALDRHEADGTTDSPEYQEAFWAYVTAYVFRGAEPPESLMQAVAGMNERQYAHMQGPEWNVTGNLRDWDVTDRLGDLGVPVLVTSGRYDEMTPDLVGPMVDAIPGAQWVVFEDSAHMAFHEERERYIDVVAGFLDRVDRLHTGPRPSPP